MYTPRNLEASSEEGLRHVSIVIPANLGCARCRTESVAARVVDLCVSERGDDVSACDPMRRGWVQCVRVCDVRLLKEGEKS